MGKQCVKLELGDVTVKLRLTLRGQKELRKLNPDPGMSVLGIIMGSVDEPEDMGNLLTQALNWDGNKNEITDGYELYDLLVDNGYRGSEAFLKLALEIADNAGLITYDERKKMERALTAQLRKVMDGIEGAFGEEPALATLDDMPDDEEGKEGSENPQQTLRALDS